MINEHSISAIIPTYNRASTIERSIISVKNQTLRVDEIIVVDDCSTDDTIELLNTIDHITVLQTDINSGAQAARNIGIKVAKSDWIAFLDSDDEWLPNKIKKQAAKLKCVNHDPFTVIHGDCFVKDGAKSNREWNLEKTDGVNVYKQLLSSSSTFFPAILTSKLALENIGYLDESITSYQEWDTAIQLSKFCKFIHIQEPLFIYNMQNNSISKSDYNNINGYYKIVKKYEKEIISQVGKKTYRNHMINCSNMASNNGNFKFGRELLLRIKGFNISKLLLITFGILHIKPKHYFQIYRRISWRK